MQNQTTETKASCTAEVQQFTLRAYLLNIIRNAQEIATSRDASEDISDAAAAILADVCDIVESNLDLDQSFSAKETKL